MKPSSKLPSLDGWRAVSIALVLGSHSPRVANFPQSLAPIFKWFDGDLGVRFFFIISGFLISWLMISESDKTGGVSLRHFYARRALRILPVYLAFLCTIAILQLVTPFTQSAAAWMGNCTFTTNFIQTGSWPSGHLWSLSVEEQFYFIWPGVFLLCHGQSMKIRSILMVLIIPLFLAPISRIITFKHFSPVSLEWMFAHFSFFNYFDSLAVGCLCAILLARRRQVIEACLQRRPKFAAIGGIVLVLTPYMMQHTPMPGRIIAATGNSLQAGGFAILLLQSIISPQGGYRMLNWSWVRFIGVLSYSLYIWQQLFCTPPDVFGLKKVWWMSFPWWLASVFIVACISYYGFERPLLKLRAHFRDAQPALQ